MDIPYILKQALISSIADIAAARGGYVGDLRTYTRNRKLTTFDIISLLIGFSGGSLNKELRLFNTDVTPALSQRRKGISPRAFYEVWQSFNRRCDSLTRQRFHGKYHLWAVDETELPIFRNPNSSSFIITPTNSRHQQFRFRRLRYGAGRTGAAAGVDLSAQIYRANHLSHGQGL